MTNATERLKEIEDRMNVINNSNLKYISPETYVLEAEKKGILLGMEHAKEEGKRYQDAINGLLKDDHNAHSSTLMEVIVLIDNYVTERNMGTPWANTWRRELKAKILALEKREEKQ